MAVPAEIMALQIPDVPPISDSADSEFRMIRAFLQNVAIKHNASVLATRDLADNIRDHIRLPLEQANNEVIGLKLDMQMAANEISGMKMDMQTVQNVVNAHNKESINNIEKLTASADSAMLAASFRLTGLEREVSDLQADSLIATSPASSFPTMAYSLIVFIILSCFKHCSSHSRP